MIESGFGRAARNDRSKVPVGRASRADRADRIANERELAWDLANASRHADEDALARGIPLADFECRHDRLPGDRTPVCGCWPQERIEPAETLHEEAVRAAAKSRKKVYTSSNTEIKKEAKA